MKKVIALVALAALTGSAYAQLNPLPPPSTLDGVSVQSLASSMNSGSAHWGAVPGLASYKFATHGTLGVPNTQSPDNVLGLDWASWSAAVNSHLSSLNVTGGTVRVIFLGSSAGWTDDFGYTYSGNPSNTSSSYTVFKDIQAVAPGNNVTFGDYADITLGVGQASTFDLWMNGPGTMGLSDPPPPTYAGGYYTAFHQTNSDPYNAPGNVRLTTDALSVNTWLTTTSGDYYSNVNTYLVSFEDWNLIHGSDKDYNDLMVAIQFFKPDGTPDQNPVPEPSTYGLIGAAALLGLAFVRRIKSKK